MVKGDEKKREKGINGVLKLFVWFSLLKWKKVVISSSLLSIQYVLGTLLDASNTKIKIKIKQNRNKTRFLT